MADNKNVKTTYDSGGRNTQTKTSGTQNTGDWGSDVPQGNNPDDALLKVVMDDFKAARDYVKDNYQDDWSDYWKCYNSIRTRRGYEGVSDDFVPESFTIIESVKANVAGGKPKFTFVPLNDSQNQETETLNELLDYYWDCNRMTQKTLNWVQDMLVYGNGILMLSWEGDLPRIQSIPLQDFFVDPRATHMNNPEEPGYPKYSGYRYLTDRDELNKKQIIDSSDGEYKPYYSNVDDIPEFDKEWDKLDKDQKESFLGSTLGKDAFKKQVECIVYFTKKKKIVIANRQTIIYQGENPYYRKEKTVKTQTAGPDGNPVSGTKVLPEIKPFLPFAVLRNYVDSSLFYAKGDMAVIIDRQETLNDLTNQKVDNLTYVLNNMWQIDPQFSHLAEQIESVPGAVYPIPQGALNPIEKQVVTADADNEINSIKDEMRRATAADEAIQGAVQEQGRVTATEVTATINQSNQRFSTKLDTLENEGFAQVGRILFNMTQIFVTQPMAVRIIGPDGISWQNFNPNDYSGEYEPKVTLESTQKTAMAEEGQKFLAAHQLAGDSPLVNQKEFLRVYFEKVLGLPEERIKLLLTPPPPPPTPPMPEPTISVSLKADLQPDQEAQILSKLGIQSSQSDLLLGAGMGVPDISGVMQTPPPAPPVPGQGGPLSQPQGGSDPSPPSLAVPGPVSTQA